jgi:arylsulfatase A-like enzyme
LGSDGLKAEHLPVYGYERDTTPILRQLARDSLVAENAFPNSGNSMGSVVSIMTSKLPTTTRVGFSSFFLTGMDAFQHLPGILKREGYKTAEFGVPSHVDAYSINMQNSFDLVNDRSQRAGSMGNLMRKFGYENPAYFLDRLAERISERILHILFIRQMENPFILVTKPADRFSDKDKIEHALAFLDQNEQPSFIHVHLMGTHGGKYSPAEQVFSQGQEQDQPWMDDFYDDAIFSFDQYAGLVIDHLKETGQYENTILVIYSDHDPQWMVINRIPLLMHFPGNEHAGRISENVQNLDIAPTILSYLGLPVPDWMDGDSLLNDDINTHRLIFGAMTIHPAVNNSSTRSLLDQELMNPTFHQVGYLDVIDCQKWYLFNLKTQKLSSGDVSGHTAPCSLDSLPSLEEIRYKILSQLSKDKLDLSYLASKLSDVP